MTAYRNELAAAHALNEHLQRRVEALEAQATPEPSGRLASLIERGRAARSRQSEKQSRERRRAAKAAAKRQAEKERYQAAARRNRIATACRRLNIFKHAWTAPVGAIFVGMFMIPAIIEYPGFRWFALSSLLIACAWPLIAWPLSKLVNASAVGRDVSSLGELSFKVDDYLETLGAYYYDKPTVAVEFDGPRPASGVIVDVLAAVAESGSKHDRELAAQTYLHGSSGQTLLSLRKLPRDGDNNRQVRRWLRLVFRALEMLGDSWTVERVHCRAKHED